MMKSFSLADAPDWGYFNKHSIATISAINSNVDYLIIIMISYINHFSFHHCTTILFYLNMSNFGVGMMKTN